MYHLMAWGMTLTKEDGIKNSEKNSELIEKYGSGTISWYCSKTGYIKEAGSFRYLLMITKITMVQD